MSTETRVANDRITELEHKVRTLTELADNRLADYVKMRAERDRLLAERSVGQEPCAWMYKTTYGNRLLSFAKIDLSQPINGWYSHEFPLYAAPVAQNCVSVPRDSLRLAIEFLQFAQDVPTQEQRATELSAELDGLLAAHKEPQK